MRIRVGYLRWSAAAIVIFGLFLSSATQAAQPEGASTRGTANSSPQIDVVPPLFDFGTVQTGSGLTTLFAVRNTTPPSAQIDLKTVSAGDLTVFSVSLTGADAGQFSINGFSGATPPFTLMPGQSNNVTVGFNPTSAGPKSANLMIVHNGSNPSNSATPATKGPPMNNLNVPLAGRGILIPVAPTLTWHGIVLMGAAFVLAGGLLARRLF